MESKSPLVSVIVPFFNRAGYIKETLLSVYQQTYQNFELILVDDGSTDNTNQIVQNIIEQFRINGRIIRIQNSGPDAARDIGLQNARGEIVSFLDSDDWWEQNFLQSVVEVLYKNPNISFVFSDFWLYYGHDKSRQTKSSTLILFDNLQKDPHENVFIIKDGFFNYLICEQPVFIGTLAFRKDIISELGTTTRFIKQRTGSIEWEFFLRLSKSKPVAYINRPLATIRKHDLNFSGNFFRQRQGEVLVLKTILKEYKLSLKEIKMIKKEIGKRMYETLYFLFHKKQVRNTIHWSIESFLYYPNFFAIKYLLLSLLPFPILTFIHKFFFNMFSIILKPKNSQIDD